MDTTFEIVRVKDGSKVNFNLNTYQNGSVKEQVVTYTASPLVLSNASLPPIVSGTGVTIKTPKILEKDLSDSKSKKYAKQGDDNGMQLVRTSNFDIYPSSLAFTQNVGCFPGTPPLAIYFRKTTSDALNFDQLLSELWQKEESRDIGQFFEQIFEVVHHVSRVLRTERSVKIFPVEHRATDVLQALTNAEVQWVIVMITRNDHAMLVLFHRPTMWVENSAFFKSIFWFDPNGRMENDPTYRQSMWPAFYEAFERMRTAAEATKMPRPMIDLFTFSREMPFRPKVPSCNLRHLLVDMLGQYGSDSIHSYLRLFDLNGGVCSGVCGWLANVLVMNPTFTPFILRHYISLRNAQWASTTDERQRARIFEVMDRILQLKRPPEEALKALKVGGSKDERPLSDYVEWSNGKLVAPVIDFKQTTVVGPLVSLERTGKVHDQLSSKALKGEAMSELSNTLPPRQTGETFGVVARLKLVESIGSVSRIPRPFRTCTVESAAAIDDLLKPMSPSEIVTAMKRTMVDPTLVSLDGQKWVDRFTEVPDAVIHMRSKKMRLSKPAVSFFDVLAHGDDVTLDSWKPHIRSIFENGERIKEKQTDPMMDDFCVRVCEGIVEKDAPPEGSQIEVSILTSNDIFERWKQKRDVILPNNLVYSTPGDSMRQLQNVTSLPQKYAFFDDISTTRAILTKKLEFSTRGMDLSVGAMASRSTLFTQPGPNDGTPFVIFLGWDYNVPKDSQKQLLPETFEKGDGLMATLPIQPADDDVHPIYWRIAMEEYILSLIRMKNQNIYAYHCISEKDSRPRRALFEVFQSTTVYVCPQFAFYVPDDFFIKPEFNYFLPDREKLSKWERRRVTRTAILAGYLYRVHDPLAKENVTSRDAAELIVNLQMNGHKKDLIDLFRTMPIMTNWIEVQIVIFLEYVAEVRARLWEYPLKTIILDGQLLALQPPNKKGDRLAYKKM